MSATATTARVGLADYGRLVREARLARELTLREVREAGGPNISFLSEIERGIGNPTLTTILAVHRVLGVLPATLTETMEDAYRRGFCAGYKALWAYFDSAIGASAAYERHREG